MPPPFVIHEAPFKFFSKCVDELLRSLSLDPTGDVTWSFSFNGSVDNVSDGSTVPDFHLDLESPHMPTPLWVGESGFSSSVPEMTRKLKLAAKIIPEIDLLIMVNISEEKFFSPSARHPLASSPPLPRSAFQTASIPHLEDPVIVEDVIWLKLRSISFHVALRGPDGAFSFDTGPLCTEGVSHYRLGEIYTHLVLQTLFPLLQMDNIDRVLSLASQRLIAEVAQTLEAADVDPVEVARVREEADGVNSSPVNWGQMLTSFRRSLYPTAHQRYCWWMREITQT